MSTYVMVTADFPGVDSKQRAKIYECLTKEKWKKVTEPGRDIDTVWYASFDDSFTKEEALKRAEKDFVECSEDYCNPKLAMQWGPSKPIFYGLT